MAASALDAINRLIDATCGQRSTFVRPAMKIDPQGGQAYARFG